KASESLGSILETKNQIKLKKHAVQLSPGGSPVFSKLLSPETKQLSAWIREYGEDKVTEMVFFLIEDLNNYFNVQRGMTASQIAELAIEITLTLWWVRMEEIIAFFEAMKKQRYGKIYERLDQSIIWEHWKVYSEHRDDYSFENNNKYKQVEEKPKEGTGTALNGITGLIGDIKNKFRK